MNNLKKLGLTALAGSLVATSVSAGDLSVTGGSQLKYKISFANQASGSKEARIRGVSLNY